jgi:hypothetical protein
MLDDLMEACGQEERCLRHVELHPHYGRSGCGSTDYQGTVVLVVNGPNPAKKKPRPCEFAKRANSAAEPQVREHACVLLKTGSMRVQIEQALLRLLSIGLGALLLCATGCCLLQASHLCKAQLRLLQ